MRTPVLLFLAMLSTAGSAQQAATSQQPAAASAASQATPAPPSSGTAVTQDAAPPAASPQQPPVTTLHVNARLVILDAVVVDHSGNVVTDLKKDDFKLTEQGEEQKIGTFYAPGHFDVAPDVTINSTADLDAKARQAPVNIVVLDEFNTLFEDMAFARYSLKKWLESQPARINAPTMLCAVSLENFSVIQDYTQDKQALIDALDHHFAAYPWQAHNYSWVAERYATAFLTLDRVAEASIGHPGHKNMLWIGRGLPVLRTRFDSIGQQTVSATLRRTVDQLRDARVTLYVIDPAGVMIDPGRYGEDAALFAPFGGNPDFEEIAIATGGRAIHGRNDVDAQIGTAIRDGASLYSFSYRPTDVNADDNGFRKIAVTVDRPGLTVYTRRGYFMNARIARTTSDNKVGRTLAGELYDASHSNMNYDAVRFTVKSTDADPDTLKLHLDADTLVWYYKADGSRPRWTVLLYLVSMFDKKGKEIDQKLTKATYTAKPGVMQDGGRPSIPIDAELKLTPNPKAVKVRVVVRVEANGRMGTAEFAPGTAVDATSFVAAQTPAATTTPPAQ